MERYIKRPCRFRLDPSGTVCYVDVRLVVTRHTKDGEVPVGPPILLNNFAEPPALAATLDLPVGNYEVEIRLSTIEAPNSRDYFEYEFLVNDILTYRAHGNVDPENKPGYQRIGVTKIFQLHVEEDAQ